MLASSRPEVVGPPEDMKKTVRAYLLMTVDPETLNPFSSTAGRDSTIKGRIREKLSTGYSPLPSEAVVSELYNELVGLGPLQQYMDNPDVSDILVNRFDEIYIERQGHLELTPARFRDQAHLEQVIQKIVALVGREINVDKPLADARMPDGSRANAVFAPVGGPTLCIRKFNRLRLALAPRPGQAGGDWVSAGGMSPPMAAFLEAMAIARANVLIAGATGSGKSTFLRSLVSSFPASERVITIEDTAELDLGNPHWVKLECVHSKELAGRSTQERRLDVADLVQNALRMRPDRLIIGEIRHSKEAYYTLEALNTGHDGSATTIHASSCRDALARIELLVSRDFGQLTSQEIRGYVARVIDLVVFLARLRGGRRCVLEISELRGLQADGSYDLQPIFRAAAVGHPDRGGVEPHFVMAAGHRLGPRLQRKLELQGLRWI